jgi:type IV secretion system protein VirB8
VEERERYFFGILQVDYNEILALSDDEVARSYDKDIRDKMEKLGAGTEEHFKIINVTLPPDQVGRATVRFEKRSAIPGRPESASAPRYFIATLAYRFVPSPTGSKDTLSLNPLGFKVSSYVVEQELGGQR